MKILIVNSLLTLICLPLILLSQVAISGPHEAAPMLATPSKALKQQKSKLEGESIQKKFINAYEEAGSPSIAFFWNRSFDDQISQWESNEREIVTGEKSINARDVFKENGDISKEELENGFANPSASLGAGPSGGSVDSYDRTIKGGSKILSTKHSQVRVEQQKRVGLDETAQFTFSSAFINPFINSAVKVLDRASIMRIIERDIVREAGAEMIADQQKIETEALVGYADLLAEVLMAEDKVHYLISVKEIGTGRILTSFKSNGRGKQVNKWANTSKGFEKKASYKNSTLEEIANQLAIETMQHLTGVINDL